jgi:hypothetical protein
MTSSCTLILSAALLGGLCAAASAAAPLSAPVPGVRGTGFQADTHRVELSVSRSRLEISPIRLEDLADGPQIALSHGQIRANGKPGGLTAQVEVPILPLHPIVRRQLSGLWQVMLPRGTQANNVRVRIQAESVQGEAGMLRPADGDGPPLPVRLTSLPNRISQRSADTSIVEGDVVLEIATQDLRAVGRYAGHLVITLEGT